MARQMDAQHQLQLEVAPVRKSDGEQAHLRRLGGRAQSGHADQTPTQRTSETTSAVRRPSAAELLKTPGALLTRSHLRGLGLERRAIDAVFRALPVVALPGYSRPMIRVEQYLQLVDQFTYGDDRVRPIAHRHRP